MTPAKKKKNKHLLTRCIVFVIIALAYAASVIWYSAPINAYLHLSRTGGNTSVDSITSDQSVKFFYIDVGQGDATFVEFPDGKDMIIDSGPSAGYDKLMSFFAGLNPKITGFDYILLTHSDADHCDNFPKLLQQYPLKSGGLIYRPNQETTYSASSPDPADSLTGNGTFWGTPGTVATKTYSQCIAAFYSQAAERGGEVEVSNASVLDTRTVLNGTLTLNTDMDFYGGDYVVRFYGPTVANYGTNANNYSPIFTVDYEVENGGKPECERALFSGDCETVAERDFVNNRGPMFDDGEEITGSGVDVIKLGHHGSNTSSCTQYLDTVLPSDNTNTLAIASADHAGNNYNLPSAAVIKRLTDTYGFNPDNVLKTQELGTIAVAFTPGGVVCGDATVTIPRPALQWATIGAAIVVVAFVLIFFVPAGKRR